MDDYIFEIIKEFELKAKFIKKIKYMYICETDKGTKVLKPTNIREEELLCISKFKEYIKYNGVFTPDIYYYTKKKLPFVIYNDVKYILTDYLEGTELDFNNKEHVKNIIECIGKLHNLSKNFKENILIGCKNNNIEKNFIKKTEELCKLKKVIKKQKRLSDFDIIFIKNYDYFYSECIKSINLLNKNIKNIDNIYFCHNNLKEDNLIIGNKTYITNFEEMSLDHYVFDISNFILRYIRKKGDTYLEIDEILEIYNKYNNINKEVMPVLIALLSFPDRFITTCINFYEKKRKFTPISLSNQLNDIINLKEFHKNYISKIKI